MKLSEFKLPSEKQLAPLAKTVASKQTYGQLHSKYMTKKHGRLGSGAQASVYSTRGGVVKNAKVADNRTVPLKDSGIYFMFYAHKYWQTNPCLPKITKIQIVRSKGDKPIIRVWMERLIPHYKIDKEDLEKIKSRYFVKTRMDISDCMHRAFEDKRFKIIKDPRLLKVAKVAWRIRDTIGNSFVDMHSENFMFRRGTKGLELVVTDPLHGSNSSP